MDGKVCSASVKKLRSIHFDYGGRLTFAHGSLPPMNVAEFGEDDRPYRPSDFVFSDSKSADDFCKPYSKRRRRRMTATALRTRNFSGNSLLTAHRYELESFKVTDYGYFLTCPPGDRDIVSNNLYHRHLFFKSYRRRRWKKRTNERDISDSDVGSESPLTAGGGHNDVDYFEFSTDGNQRNDQVRENFMGHEIVQCARLT